MKTISFKLILAFLLVPLFGFSGNSFDGRHTKQKKITRSFEVSPDAYLEIDNSYGNIYVSTWDQNRVEIEVMVRTNGNDEEKVLKRLEEIDVNFSHSRSKVSAETIYEKESSSWFSSLFSSFSNVNIEINYRIMAPVTNNLDLENDYGTISIDVLEGNARIDCDYGRLLIGELRGDHNELSFNYTNKSRIDYIKRGNIEADYSEFTIEEAGTIELSADYTDTYIKKVENISFEKDYGSIRLDKVRNVKGEGDYLSTQLGAVYNSVELDLDYGSASIERVMKSARKIDIDSDYTDIKIGYDPEAPFSFDIQTSYANVRGIDGGDFTLEKRHQSGSSDTYGGHYLDDSGTRISIDSSHGDITFRN